MKSIVSSLSLGGVLKVSRLLPVMDLEDIFLEDVVEEEFSREKNGEMGLEFCAEKRENTRRRSGEKEKRS